MNELIYKGALNSLSFGNISYNLLREMYKKDIKVSLFPIGDKVDLEAFDKIDESFKQWLASSINERFDRINKDLPTLHQWHLNGSENRLSKNQTLFTFHELDEPTDIEIKMVNLQDNCIFSSSFSQKVFNNKGCNSHFVPVGFDEDFCTIDREPNDFIHFGIIGKFEKRKNTGQIIHQWAKKYGNNYNYQLTCCIDNPFIDQEQMQGVKYKILGGKNFGNINFLPRLKTNSEVNDFMNNIDIDLSGLSGAEGWNLPAFNATCLGKWSIVMNHTSHLDWSNEENSILVKPSQQIECYDNAFFHKGQPFNQGNINVINDDEMVHAFEESEKKAGNLNEKGLLLKSKFTYEKTLNNILSIINEK